MKTLQATPFRSNAENPWPWREACIVVIAPLLLGLGLSALNKESLLSFVYAWLRMNASGADSWAPMKIAIDHLTTSNDSVYQALFFERKIKFQYPPTSLLPHKILALLHFQPKTGFFNQINWLLILANASLGALFGMALAHRARSSTVRSYESLSIGILSFLACLFFYPVMKAYSLGQIQVWIDVLFALGCIAWYCEKKYLAGILIGLTCLIKPQFSLFFLWGLLRAEKEFIAGWLSVILPGLGVSLFLFGLHNHLDYLKVLDALAKTGESYHANQSINGFLNRLFNTGPVIVWEGNAFPAYHPVTKWGTFLSSMVIISTALLYGCRRKAGLLDFQLAALAFTMASPIAWEHHYGILPLIYIAMYFELQNFQDEGRQRLYCALLAASYLLTANYIGTTQAITGSPLNMVYSYLFCGAALLMGLLYILTKSPSTRKAGHGLEAGPA